MSALAMITLNVRLKINLCSKVSVETLFGVTYLSLYGSWHVLNRLSRIDYTQIIHGNRRLQCQDRKIVNQRRKRENVEPER